LKHSSACLQLCIHCTKTCSENCNFYDACHHSLPSGGIVILKGLHKRFPLEDFKLHFEQTYLEPAFAEALLSFSFFLHSFCAICI
jgi:hypothetical protein